MILQSVIDLFAPCVIDIDTATKPLLNTSLILEQFVPVVLRELEKIEGGLWRSYLVWLEE